MRTEIYTLDQEDLSLLRDEIPDYVINRSSEPGFFTLGAVGKADDEDGIIGVAQFYINITEEGECFSELIYVYVNEEYRRNGIGTKLLERVSRILKKSDIKTSTFIVPDPLDDRLGYEISMDDLGKFFGECSYLKSKDDNKLLITTMDDLFENISKKRIRFARLTGR